MTAGTYRHIDPSEVKTTLMDKYEEVDVIPVFSKTSNSKGNQEWPSVHCSGPWRCVAMCLGLLCALLLSATALLYVTLTETQISYHSLRKDFNMLQTINSNWSSENAQLQERYYHLNAEKLQLQDKYNNLYSEMTELQRNHSSLNQDKSNLQNSNNILAKEIFQLQESYSTLNEDKLQLQSGYNTMNKENIQLQANYLNLSEYSAQLQTAFSNLSKEKTLLQSSYDNITSEKYQLQDKFNIVAAEKDELQERFCKSRVDVAQHAGVEITQYAVDVTLDPDSADSYLILSADGKQVRRGNTLQNLPHSSKRFVYYGVQGEQGCFAGRFYFEVQTKGNTRWELGVAQESSNRRAMVSDRNPDNGYWVIKRSDGSYWAGGAPPVDLHPKVKPERVGVFVDYDVGWVSFHDADRWNLIYAFKDVYFRDKIYPYLYTGQDYVSLTITNPVTCK
ncbi:hypothetical protein ACEWY4_025045 [Coilia grayii]|uniref:B30.2/SPRY domain-containing protein n=1 Tax=Coilia grayii TaxID=363190 RepID=A0ABD1IWF3_9TELE